MWYLFIFANVGYWFGIYNEILSWSQRKRLNCTEIVIQSTSDYGLWTNCEVCMFNLILKHLKLFIICNLMMIWWQFHLFFFFPKVFWLKDQSRRAEFEFWTMTLWKDQTYIFLVPSLLSLQTHTISFSQ